MKTDLIPLFLLCSLHISYDSKVIFEEFIIEGNYACGKVTTYDIDKHKYIVFYQGEIAGVGEPTVTAILDALGSPDTEYVFSDIKLY